MGLSVSTPGQRRSSTSSAASTFAELSGTVTITQTPAGPSTATLGDILPPGSPASTVPTSISAEFFELQQAGALIKEQQERMRQQTEQSAKDRAEFKIAVENEKELEKVKKLVEDAEQSRKRQAWATRILGLIKPRTQKEKDLRAMAQE